MQQREGVHITEPQIKEVLNKRRLNKTRPNTANPKPRAQKRLRMSTDTVDDNQERTKRPKNSSENEMDLNHFLLSTMSNEGIDNQKATLDATTPFS